MGGKHSKNQRQRFIFLYTFWIWRNVTLSSKGFVLFYKTSQVLWNVFSKECWRNFQPRFSVSSGPQRDLTASLPSLPAQLPSYPGNSLEKTQQPPNIKPGTTGGSTGRGDPSGRPVGLSSVVPACGNKKVITMKALGTVKWFNVRNRCGYITRNDTKEDAFTHQTAIKLGHSRRPLCSGRWREFDVEGEKGAEAANATGPGGVPGRKYAAGRSHDRRYPPRRALHAITSRITRIVSGESMRDQRAPES